MLRRVPSIRLKMMIVALGTCVAALTFAGVVLVAYDVRSHQTSWARDLLIQAEMIGRASAPAIVFGDTLTAHQSLGMLTIRPEIEAGAVYTRRGLVFARYQRDATHADFPTPLESDGYRYDGDRLTVFKAIDDLDGRVGTVVLIARYDLLGRLSNYLPVLGFIGIGSLLVALLMSSALQSAVTRPILAIADVAREVGTRRDFSLRVAKETQDETGQLVDAFNAMLEEVESAQYSLLDSNRRKDEFLATLAHELRNPLGPIRNAAQYLKLKGGDPESIHSLEIIERQVQQMARLMEDLLDISRITRDALELRFSEFTVRDLIQDVTEATQFTAHEAGQDLRVTVEDPGATLHADRARIVQVVSNLVNNAVKYTPRGGRIEIAARAPRGDLVVAVSDDGIGIPRDKLADIFEPFSQLDRSLEKTRGGLGIGLALSKRLVEMHHGTITAESRGPGQGSTFRVVLPVVSASAPRARLTRPAPRLSGQRRSILVADDNADAADSLATLLHVLGHETGVAHDGIEAFDCLATGRFEIAILDIGMPRLNGYDLARKVRAEPWGRSLVLIALTGWGQSDDKRRALDAGFDRHLTKPVEIDQLTGVLAGLENGVASRARGPAS